MARRGRRGGSGKVIDNLRWIGASAAALALVPATPQAAQVLVATTAPDTVMRTRGNLLGFLDGTPDPGDLVEVAVGLIIVPEGTGNTVLQSPLDDANADWFWYERFALAYEESAAAVEFGGPMSVFRSVIDSKAMRRARPDTEVQCVFEQATAGGAATVNVLSSFRFLLGN